DVVHLALETLVILAAHSGLQLREHVPHGRRHVRPPARVRLPATRDGRRRDALAPPRAGSPVGRRPAAPADSAPAGGSPQESRWGSAPRLRARAAGAARPDPARAEPTR